MADPKAQTSKLQRIVVEPLVALVLCFIIFVALVAWSSQSAPDLLVGLGLFAGAILLGFPAFLVAFWYTIPIYLIAGFFLIRFLRTVVNPVARIAIYLVIFLSVTLPGLYVLQNIA